MELVIPGFEDLKNIIRSKEFSQEFMETLAASATPATLLAASATPATPCVTDFSEVSVGEEIIRTCVTPSKVKEVEAMLKVEKQRHLCALKHLHFFFSKEELSMSNTEGTHGKQTWCKESTDNNGLQRSAG